MSKNKLTAAEAHLIECLKHEPPQIFIPSDQEKRFHCFLEILNEFSKKEAQVKKNPSFKVVDSSLKMFDLIIAAQMENFLIKHIGILIEYDISKIATVNISHHDWIKMCLLLISDIKNRVTKYKNN